MNKNSYARYDAFTIMNIKIRHVSPMQTQYMILKAPNSRGALTPYLGVEGGCVSMRDATPDPHRNTHSSRSTRASRQPPPSTPLPPPPS